MNRNAPLGLLAFLVAFALVVAGTGYLLCQSAESTACVFAVSLLVVVWPVVYATRLSYRRGFDDGRREGATNAVSDKAAGETARPTRRAIPASAVRCCVYASCISVVLTAAIWFCPRYLFGLSDDEVAAALIAMLAFNFFLAIANAVIAGVLLAVFDAGQKSWMLWLSIVLPPVLVVLTPAIGTA